MKHLLLSSLLTFVVFGCLCKCMDKKQQKNIIKPLHPYRSTPTDYNADEDRSRSFVVKYFFVENVSIHNTLLQDVEQYVEKYGSTDSDFARFGNYQIWLYRKTSEINENFKENFDGTISYKSLSDYDRDLLFKFIWIDQKFSGCEIYSDGDKTAVKRNIKGSIYKDTTTLESLEEKTIKLERLE